MENINIYTDTESGKEFVTITNNDGSFTNMLKSTYDEQQAQQLGGN